MIITKMHIAKFRGFQDISFNAGTNITVIAGQNGTQKTTLLGILSQPFSITDKANPLYFERPLCGGNYKSAFAEKFKLSETFDKPKEHEWTLTLCNNEDFTLESIPRGQKDGDIRFWRKGTKDKGSGYLQLPVIYLSLSRLFPLGETTDSPQDNIIFDTEEQSFYEVWHNKILCLPNLKLTGLSYISGTQKQTLGVNTNKYDWRQNSAGQDNIGKILLAILSFRRLSKNFPKDYTGGILAIDEIDATLFPSSQILLLDALRKFSSDYKIQVFFTTHSLSILQNACLLRDSPKFAGQVKTIYLEKRNDSIVCIENLSYESITNRLNVSIGKTSPINKAHIFVEDKECEVFLKCILKGFSGKITISIGCGCATMIDLAVKKTLGFNSFSSIIVVDGDVHSEKHLIKKIKIAKNVCILPGNLSPERLLAKYISELNDNSPIWSKIHQDYSKQVVFKEFSLIDIMQDRTKAKNWFISQKPNWGRGCCLILNPWIIDNRADVDCFITDFHAKVDALLKHV